MRAGLALLLLSFGCAAWAQTKDSLFSTVRSDVTIVVTEHSTSADMVEVTMLNEDYPPDLLKRQIENIGKFLGAGIRFGEPVGKVALSDGTKLSFVKAKFATDGLIDRRAGVLRVEPLVKAFTGAPEPYTVQGLSITFDGELPSPDTVRSFEVPGVLVAEGRVSSAPAGVEYRVKLLAQDPDKINFPEKLPGGHSSTAAGESAPDRSTLILILFIVAGVAAAALVYLALLRPRSARPRKR